MPAAVLNAEQFTALDESRRSDYRQNGDTYELIIDGFDNHSAVTGLKTTNQTLKQEKTTAAQEAAAYKALGLKPEDIQALKEEKERREREDLEAKGQYDTLTTTLKENHTRELQTVKDQAAEREQFLGAELDRVMVDAEALTAINDPEIKGNPHLLLGIVKPHLKRVEVDSPDGSGKKQFAVVVLGADGKPRIKDGVGTPFTVKDLVLELRSKPEYGGAFPAPQNGGGGARNDSGAQRAGTVTKKSDVKTDADRAKYIGEHGMKAWLDLPNS